MSKALYATSVALGNALTAYREFSRVKSATVSPDGMLGGRGYVMGVRDMRQKMWDACEALSAVADTLHDEVNAPHWKPKLALLDKNDAEDVERFVEESQDVLENPEGDAAEDIRAIEEANDGKGKKKKKKKKDEEQPASETPTGGDQAAEDEAQPPSLGVKEASSKLAGGLELDIRLVYEQLASLVNQIKAGEGVPVEHACKVMLRTVTSLLRSASRSPLIPPDVEVYLKGIQDNLKRAAQRPTRALDSLTKAWREANELNALFTGAKVAACEGGCDCGGPRVDNREPDGGQGPWGSYNKDEDAPPDDNWEADEGVSRRDDFGEDYDYPSETENEAKTAAGALTLEEQDVLRAIRLATWDGALLAAKELGRAGLKVADILVRKGIVYTATTTPGETGYGATSQGKRLFKKLTASEADVWADSIAADVWAQSVVPDESLDDTETDAWDFGIGFGAKGQGAGNYANPSDEGNGKGVWGPHAELPGTPSQSSGDTSTQVDEAINRKASFQSTADVDAWITKKAAEYGSKLKFLASDEYRDAYEDIADVYGESETPGDVVGPPARADYYDGPKDNLVQADVDAWAESVLPAEPDADVDHELAGVPDTAYVHEDTETPYNAYDYKTNWPEQNRPEEQPFAQDGDATR